MMTKDPDDYIIITTPNFIVFLKFASEYKFQTCKRLQLINTLHSAHNLSVINTLNHIFIVRYHRITSR